MRPLLVLLAIALLNQIAEGCGGTSTREQGGSTTSASSRTVATTTSGTAPAKSGLIGDHDKDSVGDSDTDNNEDNDNDAPLDYKASEENLYYDRDDMSVVRYGHEAGEMDKRAVTAIVKQFYRALAAGNGTKACSLITASLSKAAVPDYGRAAGPAVLRGLNSCGAIVLKLSRQRAQPPGAGPATAVVSDVRVQGNDAYVLLRFGRVLEPRQLAAAREGGRWRIATLADAALS